MVCAGGLPQHALPRRASCTVWLVWRTHKALARPGPLDPAVAAALLLRWLALGSLRAWETFAEPAAAWTPFYAEVKLLLVLGAAAVSPQAALAAAHAASRPLVRVLEPVVRHRVIPRLVSVGAATTSLAQEATVRLLAPALPADELREWETDLRLQARVMRRAACALAAGDLLENAAGGTGHAVHTSSADDTAHAPADGCEVGSEAAASMDTTSSSSSTPRPQHATPSSQQQQQQQQQQQHMESASPSLSPGSLSDDDDTPRLAPLTPD